MPMLNPPHLGDFIRTEVIEAHGLSVTAAAAVLGVSRPALSAFLNGRASLSGEMAVRIHKAFGLRVETLLRMQNNYDIAQARLRARHIRVRRFRARNTRQGGRHATRSAK
jgi:addiction module HigA family antidote